MPGGQDLLFPDSQNDLLYFRPGCAACRQVSRTLPRCPPNGITVMTDVKDSDGVLPCPHCHAPLRPEPTAGKGSQTKKPP